ncbi:MAG: type II toxin-antitoxin system Y4mF family antitoxin [Deltaproteobacteria bacterium]|nr:type II toxin-antitoxin system Y4mF family antitoxin [Deltaproteobacteria bacterium]
MDIPRTQLDPRVAAQALGRAIRHQRKALRLTQAQLAQLAGCGVAFLYLLESGKPTVRLDKLLDVLDVLGLQLKLELGRGGLVSEDLP